MSLDVYVRCYDLAGRLMWRAPGVSCAACGEVLLGGALDARGKCDECTITNARCARCDELVPVDETVPSAIGEVCRECGEAIYREPSGPSCACGGGGCFACVTDVERR